MYGQTEATARMSYLPADHCLEKIGSIGIAIPGGTFHLEDVDPATGVGELIYEGPNVTLGMAECRADLSKGDERRVCYIPEIWQESMKTDFTILPVRKKDS